METAKPEYASMSLMERGNFLSHSAADVIQQMYYGHDKAGLEVLIKNFKAIIVRARDCVDCLEMLHKEGDVYAKLWLMLEYIGKDGINEDFVSGLEELTECAQECLARNAGVIPTGEEEQAVMRRLRNVMDRAVKRYAAEERRNENVASKE